jgi:hypothetical protein
MQVHGSVIYYSSIDLLLEPARSYYLPKPQQTLSRFNAILPTPPKGPGIQGGRTSSDDAFQTDSGRINDDFRVQSVSNKGRSQLAPFD